MKEEIEDQPSADAVTQCLNCSSESVASFCQECGQSSSIQRYSLKTIGKEAYEQFRKIDLLTTFRTFWQLTIHPGEFVRSYLSGHRVGYLAPIKFFFYSFAVQVMVGSWLFWLTNDRSFENLSHLEFSTEIVSFVSTAFWGVLWALFYRRSGFNIVECMVAALFFAAQTNFFGIILQLITYPIVHANLISGNAVQIIELILPIVYSFHFVRQLFEGTLVVLILKQLILNLLYVILIVVLFVAFFVVGQLR